MKNEDHKWERISCPICNNHSFNFLFKKEGEPFVKCSDCSLVLINPRPTFDKILQTYGNDYSRDYVKKAEKKLRRSFKRVNLVKKYSKKRGRWLDIGCSAGFVVKAAAESGFEAFGVDVEPWGIDYGKNNLNLDNLSTGQLEQQGYPDNYFDVISLYDVIEHVPDLNRLINELKRILATDGIIDIITPDIGHFSVTRPLCNWKAIKPSEHLYYFEKRTLNALFNKYNLTIHKVRFGFKSSLKVYIGHI